MQLLCFEAHLTETKDFQADEFQELCSRFVETTEGADSSPLCPFPVGDEVISTQHVPGADGPEQGSRCTPAPRLPAQTVGCTPKAIAPLLSSC